MPAGVESHQTVEESNVLAAVGDCNGNGVATALDVGYDIGLRQSGKRFEIGRLGYWSHKPVAVLEIVYILFGREYIEVPRPLCRPCCRQESGNTNFISSGREVRILSRE